MTIIRTRDLCGAALDWAVARAYGVKAKDIGISEITDELDEFFGETRVLTWDRHAEAVVPFTPSTSPAMAGEAIAAMGMSIEAPNAEHGWIACIGQNYEQEGPDLQTAVMRCRVEETLGGEVDIPDSLIPKENKAPRPRG